MIALPVRSLNASQTSAVAAVVSLTATFLVWMRKRSKMVSRPLLSFKDFKPVVKTAIRLMNQNFGSFIDWRQDDCYVWML